MPAPSTVVVFVDEDGDEFPLRLPGVWRANSKADIEAARFIAAGHVRAGDFTPKGELEFDRIEYLNDEVPA